MINKETETVSKKFGPVTPLNIQFSSIHDGPGGLSYELQEPNSDNIVVRINFGNVVAYRVADEGVLLKYWACHLADTSHLIWEFHNTDFLSWMKETSFNAYSVDDGIRHFIVVTATVCLEVLTHNEPLVSII